MPATHKYNDFNFSATGRPQWGESAMYEKTQGGRPRRRVVKYSITQWFLEPSFADNMARFLALRSALATPEGVLLIVDEVGKVVVNKRVRVVEHGLPEQWAQHLAEVKVSFEAVEELTGATEFDASVIRCEVPIYFVGRTITILIPCFDFSPWSVFTLILGIAERWHSLAGAGNAVVPRLFNPQP